MPYLPVCAADFTLKREPAPARARGPGEGRNAACSPSCAGGGPYPLHPSVPAALLPVRRRTVGAAHVCGGYGADAIGPARGKVQREAAEPENPRPGA